MKTLEGVYIDVYSEDISEHDKTTSGGIRIELLTFDEQNVLKLTRREAKELAKILREKS